MLVLIFGLLFIIFMLTLLLILSQCDYERVHKAMLRYERNYMGVPMFNRADERCDANRTIIAYDSDGVFLARTDAEGKVKTERKYRGWMYVE